MNWLRVKVLYLKSWWRGELREQSLDEILRNDEPIRPWPARFIYALGNFWLREWKWIIGTVLVGIGSILAYLRLGVGK